MERRARPSRQCHGRTLFAVAGGRRICLGWYGGNRVRYSSTDPGAVHALIRGGLRRAVIAVIVRRPPGLKRENAENDAKMTEAEAVQPFQFAMEPLHVGRGVGISSASVRRAL